MKNLNGKRAILYTRVSTADQKDHGHSLSDQKARLVDFCIKNNVDADCVFVEDYSAKNFNRPEYVKLLEYTIKNKKKIDYLLVHRWDRFSRNTLEALQQIELFKSMGIEINSTENWIEHEQSPQLLMLLINLGMPEIDNRMRSERVKEGNRRALLEGRWINMQPKGYVKGRDPFGKVLMQPCPELSPLVKEMFTDFSLGIISQNELLKSEKYKPLALTRSTLSRMLKQIVYAGKIIVPSYKDEAEQIVDALHTPLITLDTYERIQEQLGIRSRYKRKPSRVNENLPLRGHLECPKCSRNLTGSGSRSKNGNIYYYYHCETRSGCKTRFTIKDAHLALYKYFDKLKPNKDVSRLFKSILVERFSNSESSKKAIIKRKNDKINNLKVKDKLLLNKLIEDIIDNDTYKSAKKELNENLLHLEAEKQKLETKGTDNTADFINFGIYALENLGDFYSKADVFTKQKILCSIFGSKLIFENKKYRTPILNKGFDFIYQNISDLGGYKNKNGRQSFDNLPLCTRDGT